MAITNDGIIYLNTKECKEMLKGVGSGYHRIEQTTTPPTANTIKANELVPGRLYTYTGPNRVYAYTHVIYVGVDPVPDAWFPEEIYYRFLHQDGRLIGYAKRELEDWLSELP